MLKRLLALTAALAVLALPIGGATAAQPTKDIVETAAATPKFSTLVSLVKKAGLVGALSGEQKTTVFAPTNAAFAKVPDETLDALANDRAKLRQVLLYHVVPGSLPAAKVVKRDGARTAEGARVSFEVRGKRVYVNDARVITPDIRASNGIVHAIDPVLLPPGA